ncbi:hypothetical protein AMECASPLE_016795 [Ameca splendens]|uniref:Uncharacterized protein n=1 Tax=Ameca splendens TaxID=208324 RepID=A0ABV1A9Q9_9TELE
MSDEQLLEINLTDQSVLLPVGAICFGLIFTIALEEAKIKSTADRNMKSRFRDFLVEACRQVQQRLPANIQIWISMTMFSPTVILSQTKHQLTSLSLLKLYSGNFAVLDTVSGCYIPSMDKQEGHPGRGILDQSAQLQRQQWIASFQRTCTICSVFACNAIKQC